MSHIILTKTVAPGSLEHLYVFPSDLIQSGAAGPSGRGSCLGEFSLVRFSTSGRMKSDSSLTASVVLENCLLDDRRPESEAGVTR